MAEKLTIEEFRSVLQFQDWAYAEPVVVDGVVQPHTMSHGDIQRGYSNLMKLQQLARDRRRQKLASTR